MMKKVYGLLGWPVKHSLSAVMHNAAFKALGIDAEYRLFEVRPESLEEVLLGNIAIEDIDGNKISSGDIAGFNITVPHKVRALEILSKQFPFDANAPQMLEALYYVKFTGAINTIRKIGKNLEYFNTDARGFIKSLEENPKFDVKDKDALVIGCGGAGRAVIASLSWKNTGAKKIYINDTSEETIDSAKRHFVGLPQYSYLKDKLIFILNKEIPQVIKNCHLLVNATTVGMKDEDSSVIDKQLLRYNKSLYVYDLVYKKEQKQTRLIKDALDLGLPAKGGVLMLVYQGADAFNLWTDEEAPIEAMKDALRKEGVLI